MISPTVSRKLLSWFRGGISFPQAASAPMENRPRGAEPHLFAVVSWGCAATCWLAKVLNSHPEIFCTHWLNASWQIETGQPRLDGAAYLQTLCRASSAYQAVGDVHGVDRGRLPELREVFGKRFSAAVVVREPMARLHSQMAHVARSQRTEDVYQLDYLNSVIERCQVRLPDREFQTRFFVHGANMLNSIMEEAALARIFRCEDLTVSPDHLGELIVELTRGAIVPDKAWLEQVIRTPRLNAHRDNPALEFTDWQIEVIRKVVEPRTWEHYASLGYPVPGFAR